MMPPLWIWYLYIFALGACIGSFLNVVIHRIPQGKSIVTSPSACPACKKGIRFYDNIPLVSWLILRGKCRNCKAPITVRYFVIELITAILFIGLFYFYFQRRVVAGIPEFLEGGWFIYVLHITLLSALLAASAIDLKLWVIPISICWFVTGVGVIAATIAPYVLDFSIISGHKLMPVASASTASIALGATIGLIISMILLQTGIIKRSYEPEDPDQPEDQEQFNHRLEAMREVLFLLPIIICAIAFYQISKLPAVASSWIEFSQKPALAGLFGAVAGYFVGCATVWATRILGTLGFGKEAMGLGDVHLMGAAGAVLGPLFIVIAFFIAPFFGLIWAGGQMFFKKTTQIPYGPFLSLGILLVMIMHDLVLSYVLVYFFMQG